MRRIRRPKRGRLIAFLALILAVLSAVAIKSWLLAAILLIVSVGFAVIGRNYWECQVCGTLTERV